MKFVRRLAPVLCVALLIAALAGCDVIASFLSAPYGYVKDQNGGAVNGATVGIYRNSVGASNLVQTTVTTNSSGYFTLTNQVDTKGGTYVVRVTPPAGAALQFDDVTVTVPDSDYLSNLGTIIAKFVFGISGKVVNVRSFTQTNLIPTAGTVEVREFGAATATASAAISASDGTYQISGLRPGKYLVTFKDSAATPLWFGVPVSVEVAAGNVPDVGALVYKNAPVGSIMLLATWSRANYDIDSISMVGPAGGATKVYYGLKGISTPGVVDLERDVVVSDITNGAFPAETTLVTSLTSGTDMRFYVDCFTAAGSISGLDDPDPLISVQPAGVTVYAMWQESATSAVHFGTWFAPLDSSEKLVGMVSLRGNADGSISVGSFGANFTAPTTPRSISAAAAGVTVSTAK